jgi:hypothetical protein
MWLGWSHGGEAEVVSVALGPAEVFEVGDEATAWGRAVGPPGVVVGPPTSVLWEV